MLLQCAFTLLLSLVVVAAAVVVVKVLVVVVVDSSMDSLDPLVMVWVRVLISKFLFISVLISKYFMMYAFTLKGQKRG